MFNRPHLVADNKVKNVIIPSNGLYNSYLGESLNDELCYYSDEMTEEERDKLDNLIYDKLDNKVFNNRLINDYSNYLIDEINREFNCNIKYSNIKYTPMNGQNVGDYITLDLDVTSLPSIDKIADELSMTADEIWQQLEILANENFKSYNGFISYYSVDIEPLKNAKYGNWEDAYIMLIIKLLASYLADSNTDLELSFLEYYNGNGGVIELLYQCLDSDSINELDNLLDSVR